MRVSPAPPLPTAASNLSTHPPHSPHMSPAVGGPGNVVMSPHPGSGQSDGRNSSMHAPGYPQGGPQHLGSGSHGYPSKIGHMPPSSPYGQPSYQQPPSSHQYPPSRPAGPMMQPYPQSYPPSAPPAPQGPPTNITPGHQYPPRPPHTNHVPPSQPYGYSHYPQQSWGQSIGQGPPGSGLPGGPTMMGGGHTGKGGPSPVSGQPSQPGANSVGGPRPHTPPHYLKQHIQHKMGVYPSSQMYPNGPGMSAVNSRESPQNAMPPPASTPQPLTPSSSVCVDGDSGSSGGATVNSSSGGMSGNMCNNPPQIGPDGNPIVDEASQQSTVSNNSAASGDDRAGTPKSHKEGSIGSMHNQTHIGMITTSVGMLGPPNQPPHPPTPINLAPSPGTASMTSQQDDFENLNSPSWPRSPTAPPVFANSQPPPPSEVYRTTKAGDSIMRLYEMSDNPERRAWLDKLLRFMEENKTPISQCPTISKNPLDLYNLYLHVKERGGFEEVTKNKQWKDVAAVMGIGASSSGSYTLRRHYMKHILAYECKFDRGGIDPQPIINQIESSGKKKSAKSMSVPSPGSNSSSLDGYTNGPHLPGGPPGMPGSYQFQPSGEYPGHMQPRPPVQSAPVLPGYQPYQSTQYPGYQSMHGSYAPGSYPNSGYPPDNRGYQPSGPPNHQGNYQPYQQPGGYQRPGPPYAPSQQSYQQEPYTGYQGSTMYPQKPGAAPSPGPQQQAPPTQSYQGPRRHPDFEKSQPAWRPAGQYGSYPTQAGNAAPQQPWPRPAEAAGQTAPPQWNQPRYPSGPSPGFSNQGRWTNSTFGSGVGSRMQGTGPSNKGYVIPAATSFKSGGYGQYMGKQLFPMDSVEAVSPVLVRRKRMMRSDIPPVDPWKLLMCLRCGLAAEVTWAIDVLNILLFDDQTVIYFGLQHMPGLLETLIEHLRRGLINMFNICSDLELGRDDEATGANKRIKSEQHEYIDHLWYERPPPSPTLELDLGILDHDFDHSDKEVVITNGPEYTMMTRTGRCVKIVKKDNELFVKEGTREWDKWEGFSSGIDTWSVGGGECTAHIICSIQSVIVPLPFTGLLPQVKKDQGHSQECTQNVENCAKVETVPVKVEVSEKSGDVTDTNSSAENVPVKDDSKISGDDSDKKVLSKSNEKGNVSKETIHKPNTYSQKNRRNTSKMNKSLDEIVKRIKKEPMHGCSENVLSESSETDSKVLLDMYLKSNASSEVKDIPKAKSENGELIDKTKLPSIQKEQEPKTNFSELKLENIHAADIEYKTENSNVHLENVAVKTEKTSLSLEKLGKLERRESTGSCKRESAGFKRLYEDLEEEAWAPDEASLSTTSEGQDWLAKRVIGIGTVIRNLSFVPGNEDVMGKSASLLALLGKTVLLHHEHPQRSRCSASYEKDEEYDFGDWCSSLAPDTHWWWPYLHHVHENTLVTLANIAGYLDLSIYPEESSRPILNGLLHWATCPASYGQDALPGTGHSASTGLSPQRLALEALVKLCVLDQNTDLVLATPPFYQLDTLCSQLTRMLSRGEDQVLREFAVNLLHFFSAADSGVARVIAMQNGCVSLLVAFIEDAESAAMSVANMQGVAALKENPELMGTSLDMVRRAANTLVYLSKVPDNARVIAACENRLLELVMSQILDTYVASQLSQVLFYICQVSSENSVPPSPQSDPSVSSSPACSLEKETGDAGTIDQQSKSIPLVPQLQNLVVCNSVSNEGDSSTDNAHINGIETSAEVTSKHSASSPSIPSDAPSDTSAISVSSYVPSSQLPSSSVSPPESFSSSDVTCDVNSSVCVSGTKGTASPTPAVTPAL